MAIKPYKQRHRPRELALREQYQSLHAVRCQVYREKSAGSRPTIVVAGFVPDATEVIEFFQDSREEFLEYDLTRLVYNLANTKKKVVGVLTALPMDGNPMARFSNPRAAAEPWYITEYLRQSFDVRMLPATTPSESPSSSPAACWGGLFRHSAPPAHRADSAQRICSTRAPHASFRTEGFARLRAHQDGRGA
jgi:hypothetical protein